MKNQHSQHLLLLLVSSVVLSASGFSLSSSSPLSAAAGRQRTALNVATDPISTNGLGVAIEIDTDIEIDTEPFLNPYDPFFPGGCVNDVENHIRLMDKSLEKTSGKSLFEWIQERQEPGETPIENASQLHKNKRFGILSHGTQVDPVYNYGNTAGLELFEQTLERLCETPSRFSTVPRLMGDRRESIKNIERAGYGTIQRAIRVSARGSLFCTADILVWTIKDDENRRIGLAALYDRSDVVPCSNTNIL